MKSPDESGVVRHQNAPLAPETVAALQHLVRAAGALPIAVQLLPFQFPSLQHLDARVERALQRARQVSGLAAKTCDGYRRAYGDFRAYLWSTREARSFLGGQLAEQRRVLETWIASLRSRGVTHTTVNTYWRGLHGILVRIAREDGVTAPTQYVETPRPGKSLPRFLTRPALAAVFRFVRNFQWRGGGFERARNVALIAVMALGGCRLGEVLKMQIEDVDTAQRMLRIKRGKGPRGGKPRVICMPPALAAAMTTYLEMRARRSLATDRVFVAVGADAPLADVTIRRLCRLISDKTGIHVAPHLLRHTCATLMRQEGIPDRLSMEQLGHASLAVLQKYSHVAPGERHVAMAHFHFDEVEEADERPDVAPARHELGSNPEARAAPHPS